MCISNSYRTALKKNKELAVNYDEEVIEWKKSIEAANEPVVEFAVSICLDILKHYFSFSFLYNTREYVTLWGRIFRTYSHIVGKFEVLY